MTNGLWTSELVDMNSPQRAESSYPWYDSNWLAKYRRAKEWIERARPDKLTEFVIAFERLRTRPDFETRKLPRVFDDGVLEKIKRTLATFQLGQLEMHEVNRFGRFVVHDHAFITELQRSVVDLVSDVAQEPVEASYNFVSLYKKLGVCPVHMDAPSAKWTLDLCIEQSEPWPIHLSPVVPWPEEFASPADDWQQSIRNSHRFVSHTLEPGQALVFAGGSQWHYRDALPRDGKEHFCHLVFFHFSPKGMGEIIRSKNWPDVFGLPELAGL
jgi:hypothetical protein